MASAPMESAVAALARASAEAELSETTRALVLAAASNSATLLVEWLALLADQRPAFLRQVQQLGVSSLRERQALANALAKAMRAARLPVDCMQQVDARRESMVRERLYRAWEHSASPVPLEEMEGVRGQRIAFYSNQLCERGTETALFDYADFAETLLGTVSFILYDASSPKNVRASVDKFTARFGERVLALGASEAVGGGAGGLAARHVASALRTHRIARCYVIKFGHPGEPNVAWFCGAGVGDDVGADAKEGAGGDEGECGRTRVLVHAVFDARTPHGDVYARISPCVPAAGPVPIVPHIVRPRAPDGADLRAELGIPPEATVFGCAPPRAPQLRRPNRPHVSMRARARTAPARRRDARAVRLCPHARVLACRVPASPRSRHGGWDVFDIWEARAAVLAVARERADIFFLFLNTRPLLVDASGEPEWAAYPPNVRHLEATLDEGRKAAFIYTCDAMLHARRSGETFGLAIAEFSAANRPVLTSSVHHDEGLARFHIDTLGAKGLFYHDQPSCEALLRGFDRRAAKLKDWNAYRAFEPRSVMAIFRDVFLLDTLPTAAHAGGGDEQGAAKTTARGASAGGGARRQLHGQLSRSSRMPSYGK